MRLRRGFGALALVWLLLPGGSALATSELPPGPKPTAPGHRRCGEQAVFRHSFAVEAQGIGCASARALLNRSCTIRIHRSWSCFSFREDAPFIVWFPTADLFKRRLYPVVLLRRYPCAEAEVTPALFELPSRSFPSRRQMLADDVLRCELLKAGSTSSEIEALLGPPDVKEQEGSDRVSFVYGLGEERDSFVQVDSEALLIELNRARLTYIGIFQT